MAYEKTPGDRMVRACGTITCQEDADRFAKRRDDLNVELEQRTLSPERKRTLKVEIGDIELAIQRWEEDRAWLSRLSARQDRERSQP